MPKPKESDWKHYCAIVDPLRDRYLAKRNAEFARQLTEAAKSPTECFWSTVESMEREAKKLENALGQRSRSCMTENLIGMCTLGMLTEEDLDGFSEGLVNYLKRIIHQFS
ncbi:hypothetical protein [Cerasicoccus fimbriatus]|uniref:hypothetical protein n=1 Tax=Cerasicoccus fimbriatus TaxID=3014554 RepID=UPI0022B2CA5C|nr:hypothetical protein [Cerasicoccus sp. TK19100]